MAGGRKIKCVTSDPRWRDMVIRYRYNFTQAVVDIFGMFPSHQQQQIIQSVQETGAGRPLRPDTERVSRPLPRCCY